MKLVLFETDGQIYGTLTGTFKVGKKFRFPPNVALSFSGAAGSFKFFFSAADGSKGTIELIRLPNKPHEIEVVWSPERQNIVFDDLFFRTKYGSTLN